ncbi:proton-coupled folate transporter-like [Harmonia axyridis]|uniref:proton-coupled folate transporter-like n=1 Tax=Harmonia axyridis TaxID=115357 RepID=UPI001E275813|nr:proton-coupled folate transporter-like [Harmonia axyridis]XP_045459997.1 proton-coupled folate transporter-like [Harmonia axyridis]
MSIGSIPRALSIEYLDIKTHNVKQKTLKEKIKFVLANITLEPFMFTYALSSVLTQITNTNFNLEKACRVQLQYNSSICDAMRYRNKSGYEDYQEIEVQSLASTMAAFKLICMGIFPSILMPFFGSWSDRHGRRKPLLVIPLIGECITCLCLYICAHFFYELPLIFNALSETLPYTLSGAWFCTLIGVYSYVSGISSPENKTLRIGSLVMCLNVGITAGIFLSGCLINLIGFKAIYLSSFTLSLITLFYCLLIVKDNHIQNAEEKPRGFLTDFFHIEHVKSTFQMCFKTGPKNRKKKMIIIMILCMLIQGQFHGEYAVLYLFTRIKFKWDEVDYSYYNGVHFCIQTLGTIFAMKYFIKYLKMDDALIGCIGVGGKLLACIIYILAPSAIYFYIGAFVDIFHGTVHVVLRALMSKIVSSEELGQSNSVFGICEAAMPLLSGPLYSTIYNYTINVFPSSFFMCSFVFLLFSLFLFGWFYTINRKETIFVEKIKKNIEQEENLLKKACSIEMIKSMEKLKNIS